MQTRFYLEYANTSHAVTEPLGWSDTRLRLARDTRWHGMRLLTALELGFTEPEIRQWIRELWDEQGTQMQVGFRAEYWTVARGWQTLYHGVLDSLSLQWDTHAVRAHVVTRTPRERLLAQWDTPIRLADALDLKGNAMPIARPRLIYSLNLPGQVLELGARGSEAPNTVYENGPWVLTLPGEHTVLWQLPCPQGRYDELNPRGRGRLGSGSVVAVRDEGIFPGLSGTTPQLEPFFENDSPLSQTYEAEFHLEATALIPEGNLGGKTRMGLFRGMGLADISLNSIYWAPRVDYDPTTNPVTLQLSFHWSGSFTLAPGERLYWVVGFTHAGGPNSPYTYPLTVAEGYFHIRQIEQGTAATVQATGVYEALERVVHSVAGPATELQSQWYGRPEHSSEYVQSGGGAYRALSRGWQLRGFPAEKQPLQLSLGELLEGLQPVDGIGWGVVEVDSQTRVVVEPARWFYRADETTLHCERVHDVRLRVEADQIYTHLTIGYSDWETEFLNGLDEPNSQRQLVWTGQDQRKNEWKSLSALITSGYSIERLLALPYAATATQDTPLDDRLFLIALNQTTPDPKVAEQGERFTQVQGLIDPSSRYNLALTPLRNLLRQLYLLTTGQQGAPLSFRSAPGNADFTADEGLGDAASTCTTALPLTENADLDWSGLLCARPLFRPLLVQFSYPLTVEAFLRLQARPYGAITYTPDASLDVVETGFLLELNYRPAEEMAEFTLLLAA